MNNLKKILFTTTNTSWGGSELLWTKTVVELIKYNCVLTICIDKRLNLPKEIIFLEKQNKITVFTFSNSNLSFAKRVLNRLLPYKKRYTTKNERYDFIIQYKPDLLIINQGFNFNGVAIMIFALQNKIKYATVSHAVNEALWPNFVLREKMKKGFQNSVANYFVSWDNVWVTQNQLGCFLNNAQVVRNPFNVPFNVELEFPKQTDFHLAFVGRYDFYAKGHDVLLQVIAHTKWKKRNLIINFYGAGNDLENLKDLVKMYALENVFIHPYTNTETIWRTNQGLVLTSRFEGLPIVIVEAMLCKRFVIVTNVSGNAALVVDNQTGFIAAAPRPEYVDEALERAWQERQNWESLGRKARKTIVNHVPENPALVFAKQLMDILTPL